MFQTHWSEDSCRTGHTIILWEHMCWQKTQTSLHITVYTAALQYFIGCILYKLCCVALRWNWSMFIKVKLCEKRWKKTTTWSELNVKQSNHTNKAPMVLDLQGFQKQCKSKQQISQTLPASASGTSASIPPSAAPQMAHHGPMQHIKADPYFTVTSDLQPGLDPLTPVRAGGGEVNAEVGKADLSLYLSLKSAATVEVKGLTSGPEGVIENCWPLRHGTWPCLPLGSQALFLGPWPVAVTQASKHKLRVRTDQGQTNEVRAAVWGDLCPPEAPIAFCLRDSPESWCWWICTTLQQFFSLARYWHCYVKKVKP